MWTNLLIDLCISVVDKWDKDLKKRNIVNEFDTKGMSTFDMKRKKFSNDQVPVQPEPHPCPQNQNGK